MELLPGDCLLLCTSFLPIGDISQECSSTCRGWFDLLYESPLRSACWAWQNARMIWKLALQNLKWHFPVGPARVRRLFYRPSKSKQLADVSKIHVRLRGYGFTRARTLSPLGQERALALAVTHPATLAVSRHQEALQLLPWHDGLRDELHFDPVHHLRVLELEEGQQHVFELDCAPGRWGPALERALEAPLSLGSWRSCSVAGPGCRGLPNWSRSVLAPVARSRTVKPEK